MSHNWEKYLSYVYLLNYKILIGNVGVRNPRDSWHNKEYIIRLIDGTNYLGILEKIC